MNKTSAVPVKNMAQGRRSLSRKSMAEAISLPLVRLLARAGARPNDITWLGFGITLGAAALIASGQLIFAAIMGLVGAFLDMLDGALARHTNRVTRFGAVLDSTLDRTSEAFLFLGIMAYYLLNPQPLSTLGVIVAAATMIASFLVSYVRARAEGIGLKCEVGLLTRTERVGLLVLGLGLGRINYALIIVVAIIGGFSAVTVAQRLAHVSRNSEKKGEK